MLNKEGKGGGQGCSSMKDDLQWARVCPDTVFWGNLAFFALPCWWSTFLTIGMFLLSNAELLLGWIIHGKSGVEKSSNIQSDFFFFFPFKIQATADLIYLEDEFSWSGQTGINLTLEVAGNDVIMKYRTFLPLNALPLPSCAGCSCWHLDEHVPWYLESWARTQGFGMKTQQRFALGTHADTSVRGYSQLWLWTHPQCFWELLQLHLGKYFCWFHCSFCCHSSFLVFGFVFFLW